MVLPPLYSIVMIIVKQWYVSNDITSDTITHYYSTTVEFSYMLVFCMLAEILIVGDINKCSEKKRKLGQVFVSHCTPCQKHKHNHYTLLPLKTNTIVGY